MANTKPLSTQVKYEPYTSVSTALDWIRNQSINVKDLRFGAKGDGVTDDTAAIKAAISFASSSKKIYFPAGRYVVTEAITLSSVNIGLVFCGDGENATIILKKFNGDFITHNSVAYQAFTDLSVDGGYGTYTGRFIVSKGTSHYPMIENVTTVGFSGEHIAFDGDSGFGANIFNHTALAGSGQTVVVPIKLVSKDTGYSVRRITACNYAGHIDFAAGCDNVYITQTQLTEVITSADCGHLFIDNVRWGNAGQRVDIYGNTFVSNCSFAESVRLMPGWDGVFVGNRQDGGSAPFLTNMSAGGLVYHISPDGSSYLQKGRFYPNMEGFVEIAGINSVGDGDYSYNQYGSPTTLVFDSSFTTNRNLILPLTDVIYGHKIRVVRTAGNTGGPWTLSVGSTGKTMAYNTWCDVIYNGGYWVVTASGNL